MSHRPFRSIGLLLLAASAFSFGIANLGAQTTPAAHPNLGPSRVDVFVGYSYFGPHGVVKPAYTPFKATNEGAVLSGAYYINKYVGGEILGFANPAGTNSSAFAGYAGPIFRAPMQNFTLFAHGLVGGVRIEGPGSFAGGYPYTWGTGLVAGGGMDYDLPFFHHLFGLRVFEADYRYIHVDYGPAVQSATFSTPGGRVNLGVAELSTGILMHIGHILPPPPITYTCAVTAPTGTIYPGDVVTVTGTAGMVNPKKTVTYTWNSDGGAVAGTSNVASVDTKTYSAGTYTVKGHVSEGMKPGEFADCSVQFTVTAFGPPTVGCSANPSTVNIGDSSTITAAGLSPQNRPLTYSYSATSGSINGNTATATLSTVGAGPGVITVTCNAVDDKGQTASQMTTVTVQAPNVAPVAVVTKSLCTISFGRDERRPARVDNEAKACLDDVALNAQRDPQAKLAITGTATPKHTKRGEKMEMKLAEERAVNTKEYLVTDKGIDASRIEVFTSTSATDSAATTLIPSGATLDTNGLTPVDESAIKAVPRTAPEHHHHHKM
jgi:outer membrane protein OmpA-like peptidoglycan-associated protein